MMHWLPSSGLLLRSSLLGIICSGDAKGVLQSMVHAASVVSQFCHCLFRCAQCGRYSQLHLRGLVTIKSDPGEQRPLGHRLAGLLPAWPLMRLYGISLVLGDNTLPPT
jgi:hypothetical protein